jgi:hypothetical protein
MGDAPGLVKLFGALIPLVILFLVGFFIYFNFKVLQFVIQAINLYKKMVVRQDATIKLLMDIRDNTKNYATDYVQVQEKEHYKQVANAKPEDFTVIKGLFGDAVCYTCNQISSMNGMYHHRATDTYYHKDCLPQLPQTAPPVQPTIQPSAQPTTLFCAQCGERLEPGIAFCPSCGTKTGVLPAVS